MSKPDNIIGFIRYEGRLVDDGFMDARKTADALKGFDEAIRFFINQENPALIELEYEIPVKVQAGSWEAVVKDLLIGIPISAAITKYAVTAAQKMAEKDFDNVGLRDIFKAAFRVLVWSIRIAEHTYKYGKQQFTDIDWKTKEKENMAGIKGVDGSVLYVPQDVLKKLDKVPSKLLSKNALVIESERTLKIGYYHDHSAEEVTITAREKHVFTSEVQDSDLLYPELIHGHHVTLKGHLIKGNEEQNSFGLKYKQHVLYCVPKDSGVSIVEFKDALFGNCEITGIVDRSSRDNEDLDRKPKIKFESISKLPESENPSLLGLIE